MLQRQLIKIDLHYYYYYWLDSPINLKYVNPTWKEKKMISRHLVTSQPEVTSLISFSLVTL